MSTQVLTIGPAHTLREAARMMAARRVGVAAGENPDTEPVARHCTQDLVFAARRWTLEEAANAMVHGGFRHLVVVERDEVVGLLSMRDIVRCWAAARVPSQAGPNATLVRS
jgi:predicted transcriptional regulator